MVSILASRKANVYMVQFGDKLAGLRPMGTKWFVAGSNWGQYLTRTYSDKMDFVFCVNQLGGVGKGRSQFKVNGFNNPDGARQCVAFQFKL